MNLTFETKRRRCDDGGGGDFASFEAKIALYGADDRRNSRKSMVCMYRIAASSVVIRKLSTPLSEPSENSVKMKFLRKCIVAIQYV